MTSSTPKVVLNASRDIPFNKLVLSQANVRRIKAGISIEDLAEDIARRGLLQSLNVRPVVDGEGRETGLFEVPAGGRRYRALERLAKQKRLPKTAPVPCIVQQHDTAAVEDSLAENIQRVSPHPLDQFRAFKALREESGMSDEEIAAAFFITPAIVKQRLKLTSVSERLLELYAEDQMSLEQLMAFTVSNDHARQEQVWEAIQRGYNKEPYLIRRMLTEGKVSASDRRAVFIGAEAYEAAGGTIALDLFQQDHGGWFEDIALLDRLVDEKLQAIAGEVMAEGWKWVEVARDFPWGHAQGLRRLFATVEPLTDEEQAQLHGSREEMERLEAEYADSGEDLPEEVDQRLAELEAVIEALEERPGTFDSEEMARAGAYVSLGHEGRVRIERGYVRPEDEAPAAAADESDAEGYEQARQNSAIQRAVVTVGGAAQIGGAAGPDEDEGDAMRPLSERLITELTAQRTLALRAALAEDPDVALVAVLHALCLRTFYGQQSYDPASCLEIEIKSASLSQGGPDLNSTQAAQVLGQLHEQWGAHLPNQPDDLWDWLLNLDSDSRMSLFAYCAARTINAMHETWNRRPRAIAHASRLAQTLRLDMAAQWSPTKENYLGRVTKAHILQAVREAKGEASAQLIDHLKKGDMAEEAERLLSGTGWLPSILRTPGLEDPARRITESASTEANVGIGADGDVDLPAFLVSGDADPVGADQSYPAAAE